MKRGTSGARWRGWDRGSEVIFERAVSAAITPVAARWADGDRLLVLVIALGPCAGEEEQKTTTKCGGGRSLRSSCGTILPPELAPGATRWLPGFKGPIPSTTLDRAGYIQLLTATIPAGGGRVKPKSTRHPDMPRSRTTFSAFRRHPANPAIALLDTVRPVRTS